MDEQRAETTVGKALGDAPRLAEVWDHFYSYCARIINQCPGVRKLSSTDREDCIQEVMVEIVRHFGEQRPESLQENLTGWIRVLSRNKAADMMRRRYRRPEVAFDDGAGALLGDDEPAAAEPELDAGETVSLVWEALGSLDQEVPVTSYLIFFLRTIEGWSMGDIAELFGITPEHARVRCHRVKKRFGEILAELKPPTDDTPTD